MQPKKSNPKTKRDRDIRGGGQGGPGIIHVTPTYEQLKTAIDESDDGTYMQIGAIIGCSRRTASKHIQQYPDLVQLRIQKMMERVETITDMIFEIGLERDEKTGLSTKNALMALMYLANNATRQVQTTSLADIGRQIREAYRTVSEKKK